MYNASCIELKSKPSQCILPFSKDGFIHVDKNTCYSFIFILLKEFNLAFQNNIFKNEHQTKYLHCALYIVLSVIHVIMYSTRKILVTSAQLWRYMIKKQSLFRKHHLIHFWFTREEKRASCGLIHRWLVALE